MSMMGDTTSYANLDPSKTEIRLLLLQPSIYAKADVQCSLHKFSLDDDPAFEALSYCWGDPTPVKSIILGGQATKVTLSAWSALRALRYRVRPRVIWIDAICINQTNPTEIASQVQLMGAIYRKATSVRVWLGSDDGNDKDAIPILQAMASAQGARDTLRLGEVADGRVAQLKHFFARSWWERLWVVQEVALAREVVFQQGAVELEYKDLLAAYHVSDAYFRENLNGYGYGVYSSQSYDFMHIFESVRILDETRNLCGGGLGSDDESRLRETTMTWTTVANLLRRRKASVDKDRLYSLYGLLPSTVVRRPNMEPSYSAATEDAFTDVTYNIMKISKSLMMFNFVHPGPAHKSAGLPSWVPDWRLGPSNESEANLRVAREPLFDASIGTPFHLQRLSANTICLKGFFVDVVQAFQCTGVVPSASPMLDGCYNSWREMWANTKPTNAMLGTYLDGTTAETAFRRTMVWDCKLGPNEGEVDRLTQDEGMAMFEAHDRAVQIAFGDDWDVAGDKLSAEDSRRATYMMNCAKGRAFFVTSQQLIGNSHPVILRPSKKYADTWQAVGECYLHAVMDGVAVRNMAICAHLEEGLYRDPAIKNLKGAEQNPRWDEITEKPDGLWKWLLVE